jgi:hypothetical protein
MKRKPMTLQDHKQAGIELKRIRSYLMDLQSKASGAFGKSSDTTRRATKAHDAVDDLRCHMENEAFKVGLDLRDTPYYGDNNN